jgi:hypothetical protein
MVEVISTSPVVTSAQFSQPSPHLRQFGRTLRAMAWRLPVCCPTLPG